MARKHKCSCPAGVPEWVVTFGDMMSLLLCFFILLQMFSELKREHEYQRVITAIKEAFGYSGGIGVLPVDDPPLKSMIQTLESMAIKNDAKQSKVSNNDDPGLDGPQMRVKTVREGVRFTIGGPSIFEEYSAELRPHAKKMLVERLVPLLKGRNNKIDVIGHAARKRLEGTPWTSLDELSFARAQAVVRILVDAGLDDRVFRMTGAGTREPVHPRAMSAAEAAENRRVDVILTELLVEDLDQSAQ